MSEQVKGTAHLTFKHNETPYDLRLSYIALNLGGTHTDRYFEARYKPVSRVQNEWDYLISTDFGDADTDIDEEIEIDAIFDKALEELNGELKKVFGSTGVSLVGEEGIKWILENEIVVEDGIVTRKKGVTQ